MVDGQRTEPLGNGVQIIVSDDHHFATDTVLLADFAKPAAREKAVDLGSGCGTIPLLWSRGNAPAHTVAVELQQEACDMLVRSIAMNCLEEKITVLHADLRNLKGLLPLGVFDLVVCNPPYKTLGSGLVNPSYAQKLARHEYTCTVSDAAMAASSLLRFGGRFCLCQRPERLCDSIQAFRQAGLEPKRLRFVQPREDKAPKLFLIEAKKGARPGGHCTEPALFIERNGRLSDEMRAIYGSYKDGH